MLHLTTHEYVQSLLNYIPLRVPVAKDTRYSQKDISQVVSSLVYIDFKSRAIKHEETSSLMKTIQIIY